MASLLNLSPTSEELLSRPELELVRRARENAGVMLNRYLKLKVGPKKAETKVGNSLNFEAPTGFPVSSQTKPAVLWPYDFMSDILRRNHSKTEQYYLPIYDFQVTKDQNHLIRRENNFFGLNGVPANGMKTSCCRWCDT